MNWARAIGHPGWLIDVVVIVCALAGVDALVRDIAGFVERRRRR